MKKQTAKTGFPNGVSKDKNGVIRFVCEQCKQAKTHETTNSCSTGYARTNTTPEQIICFACCGLNDATTLASLPIGGKMCLYSVIGQGHSYATGKLTNWPGSFEIKGLWFSIGRHNMAGKRYDAQFQENGNWYSATQYGDNSQICHIRRIKSK